jgi:hypothetical protein
MSDLETALTWIGGSAIVGGGLGAGGAALNNTAALPGIENGAGIGVGLVTIGALVVAVANPRAREDGLATAGLGLGALILGAIVGRVVGA